MEKTSACRAFNQSKIQRVLDSILGEESPKAKTGKTTAYSEPIRPVIPIDSAR